MPTPADWVAVSATTSPNFSKDGRTIFHLRGSGLAQVWAMDRDGANARPLSFHDERVAFLRRAPNDDRLVWGIDAGGDERQQFWTLAPAGTPEPLTAAPGVIHDFGAFSPDGARIAYAANDEDEARFGVSVLTIATGDRRRLFDGAEARGVTSWSSDGARLAAIDNRSTGDQSLLIVDAASGDVREVPKQGLAMYASARFPSAAQVEAGERRLAALTDQGGRDFMRLCRIEPETGETEDVHAPPGRDVEAWSLSPDGALLATVENDRGYGVLRVGAPDGERPIVAGLPEGIVGEFAWAPDGFTLAFTAQGPVTPPAIWLWDARTQRAAAVPGADPFAGSGVDPATLVAPTLVSWPAPDGAELPGWLARPATPLPPNGFPALVWVHGGPASQTRANWRPDIQMLLAQGFAVLMPNVRGSTGYGRAWMEADDRERRPVALADIVAGRAWLAAQPGIDAERIGIMGQSYGGWMVLAAITLHPELWRAACDYYGISDWTTLLRDTGPWRRDHRAQEYGVPGRDDAVLEALSPLRQVARVTAPLLVAHGDRDPRVPMNESDQFVAAMELHQKRVRYERFTYAGHGFIRPEHRRRVYEAVAEHFAAHL